MVEDQNGFLINMEAGFCFCGGWNFSKLVIMGSTFIREMRVTVQALFWGTRYSKVALAGSPWPKMVWFCNLFKAWTNTASLTVLTVDGEEPAMPGTWIWDRALKLLISRRTQKIQYFAWSPTNMYTICCNYFSTRIKSFRQKFKYSINKQMEVSDKNKNATTYKRIETHCAVVM